MDNKHFPEMDGELPAEEQLPLIEELQFSPAGEPEAEISPYESEEALPAVHEEVLEYNPEVMELLPVSEEVLPEAAELPPVSEETLPEAAELPPVSEEVLPEAAELPMESVFETASSAEDPSEEASAAAEELPELIPLWEDDEESAFTVGEAQTASISAQALSEAQENDSAEAANQADPQPDAFELELLNDPTFAPVSVPSPPADESVDQEYSDAPAAPEPATEPGKKKRKKEDPRPTRKGRPKRKKGEGLFGIPNILATVVWMGLILAIGVTMGRMLWVCAADVLAFGREDKHVTVTVYEADTMDSIIDKLYESGLIRYKSLFTLYADISDAQEDIKPGIYDLNTRYDYHALVNAMSPSSTRQVIELTIPEGYTCRQIFALLEENRVCTAVDIAAFAADGALSDYWFLENVQRGSEYCLEGYLFPDTYQFYKNSTPKEALEKMLDNFDNRFSEEMRAQIDTLNATVTDGSFTVKEVVTVASLIEKESAAPAESPTIASVIYNRLYNWDYPALLNIDAAIVYAQGGESDTIDTGIDSPYNTYRYTGLTPTPIANPGLSSLKAALEPASTNYYYYVLNPSTGSHQFSKTQEEHDGWIREFYN